MWRVQTGARYHVPTPEGVDRKKPKVLDSRAMAACVVSFVDLDGIRHSVEVEAESLYEAGALAIGTFRRHNCAPGLITKLEVEMGSSVTHTVTRQRIEEWLDAGPKSPRDFVLKERLKQ